MKFAMICFLTCYSLTSFSSTCTDFFINGQLKKYQFIFKSTEDVHVFLMRSTDLPAVDIEFTSYPTILMVSGFFQNLSQIKNTFNIRALILVEQTSVDVPLDSADRGEAFLSSSSTNNDSKNENLSKMDLFELLDDLRRSELSKKEKIEVIVDTIFKILKEKNIHSVSDKEIDFFIEEFLNSVIPAKSLFEIIF